MKLRAGIDWRPCRGGAAAAGPVGSRSGRRGSHFVGGSGRSRACDSGETAQGARSGRCPGQAKIGEGAGKAQVSTGDVEQAQGSS